jgi:hypothetical protein
MSQAGGSSKEAQNKVALFLQEEFLRLKSDHQEELHKRTMKRKNSEKKRRKLYQKIDSVLKIHSLDEDVREDLLSLQQEIKDSF